ncbi:MAG: hypothetical protein LQ352_003728 [Teloschistes flavicans]|nr:MAG: hypothetical protein LQ352_003728 [Teloschistes flavicans]
MPRPAHDGPQRIRLTQASTGWKEQDHDGDNIQHTPLNSVALTDGIHHPLHHINSVTDHHDHLALGAPFRNSATYEPNPQITTSIAPHNPVTLAPAPSTSIPSSMAPSPSPHPSAADTFSDLRTTTPLPSVPTFTSSDPPATQGHVRHPRRHRLPRWLRRRLDHPVPWRIGLRRRAENIRQILGRVERLMQ